MSSDQEDKPYADIKGEQHEEQEREQPDIDVGPQPVDEPESDSSDSALDGDSISDTTTASEPFQNRTVENSSPSFPHDDTVQRPLYIESSIADTHGTLKTRTTLHLVEEYGLEDRGNQIPAREIDTAILRLFCREFGAEDIAEEIVRMRGFEP